VTVPVYVPATAAGGIVTTIVGFHETETDRRTALPRNAVRGTDRFTACSAVSWPGVPEPSPEEAVAGPDQ
jgi:hypothetical protein